MTSMTNNIQAASTSAFLDSIGINGSADATTAAQLEYLGITHLRTDAATSAHLLAAGADGAKIDVILPWYLYDVTDSTISSFVSTLDGAASVIEAVEGQNEVNNGDPDTFNGVGGTAGIGLMQMELYAQVEADPNLNNSSKVTSVYDFSVLQGTPPGTYSGMQDFADYNNVHAYGGPGIPPSWIMPYETTQNSIAGTDPVVVTETGADTLAGAGVDQAMQARYDIEVLLDDYQLGVARTYLYDIQDWDTGLNVGNFSAYYGLYDVNGNPKLAATAMHNLTTLLSPSSGSATAATPGTLAYSLTGLSYYGNSELFQKSNGVFDLALWNETIEWNPATNTEIPIPTNQVTISLAQTYAEIAVYDPLVSASPIETVWNTSSITLGLNSDPLFVEFTQQTLAATPASGTVATTDEAAAAAFSNVVISDPTAGASETTAVAASAVANSMASETATVTLSAGANGTLSDPNAASDGSLCSNGTYTVSGSATEVASALNGLVFTPTAHEVAPGQTVTTALTAVITDTAGEQCSIGSTLTATAVDDTPTISNAPATLALADEATLDPLAGISITDPDIGVSETLNLLLLDGSLNPTDANGALSGSGLSKTGTGTYTLSGTPTAVSDMLGGLVFTPTAHQVAPGQTVATTLAVVDNQGGVAARTYTVINTTAAADPPTISGLAAQQATTQTAPIRPFATTTLSDPDTGVTETLTVSVAGADKFGQLSGTGIVETATPGLYTIGAPGISAAAAMALLQGMVFTPATNLGTPGTTPASTLTLTDVQSSSASSTTVSATAATTIAVSIPAAAAPISVTPSRSTVATTDTAPASPFSHVVISDPNAGQTETATVTLSTAANGTLSDPNAASDGGRLSNGVYTVSGTAAAVASALDGLVFTPVAHEVAPGQTVTTSLTAVITDTAGAQGTSSSTLTATAINNAPTISALPASLAISDAATFDPLAGVSISDPDTGVSESVTLTLMNSGLAATDADGTLSGAGLSKTGTGTYALSGTPAAVSAELSSLQFSPTAHQVAAGKMVATELVVLDNQGGAVKSASTWIDATAAAQSRNNINLGSLSETIVLGGNSNTVNGLNGNDVVKLSGSANVVQLGNGTDIVQCSGPGDVVLLGNGNNQITASSGMAFITTGTGNDIIVLGGSGSTVAAGGGSNTITEASGIGGNRFVLPQAGQGFDLINGFYNGNADVFDLRSVLLAAGWNQQASTLGNYLQVSSSGGNTTLSIVPGGAAIAELCGAGNLTLADLQAHGHLLTT